MQLDFNDYIGTSIDSAMPAPSPTYSVGFSIDQNLSNGFITVTIIDFWTAEGIDPADVEVAWGFTGPDIVEYRTAGIGNPGNIFPAVSLSESAPLPTTGSGVVQQGDYVVTIIARVSPPSPFPADYEPTPTTHNLCPEIPEISLVPDINCNAAWVTVNDQTQWEAQGWTVDSRELTLNYPLPTQHAPITASGPSVTTQGESIYRGRWTVQGDFSITKGNLSVDISGYHAFDVECSAESCKRWCQTRTWFTRWLTARSAGNDAEERRLWEVISRLVELNVMIDQSQACGASNLTAQLSLEFANLAGDCGCGCEGEPDIITPIFGTGGGTMWLPVQGTGIVITAGSGTYTFAVSPALLATISSLYNTVVDSPDGSVTVTSTTSGLTTTYHLSVTNPATESVRWKLRWDVRANTFAQTAPVVVGSTFTGSGITVTPFAAGAFGTFFRVQNFIASGSPQFMAKVTVASRELTPFAVGNYPYAKIVEAVMADFSYTGAPNSFAFGLCLTTPLPGGVVGWNYPMSFYDTYLAFLELEFEVYKL